MTNLHSLNTSKVYWLVEATTISGGVRVIFEMAKGLQALGWQNTILTLDKSPDWFDLAGIPVVTFDNYDELVASLSLASPVVATWWRTAYVLGKSKAVSKFYLVQDIETEYYSAPMIQELVLQTYQLGLKMFTTSHWVEGQLKIPYAGIGMRPQVSKARRSRQCLAFVRPQRLKGFSYLCEVSRRLGKDLAMPLVTIGPLPYGKIGGLHENLGRLSDREVWGRYSQSQYFLTTSWHEGFCLTNLEAMASGCAVVTTDCDGVRDYAVDGENCLIVSRDDPREMIKAVERLEFNKTLRDRIVKNGIETSKQWNWDLARLDTILRT